MSLVSKLVRSAVARRQHGGVAIMVAVSAIAVFAMTGLGIDAGRLYINRSELQTAADACALAASAQLACDPVGGATCPVSFLQNAQAAGQYAAKRNSRDFQINPVVIASSDIKFHTALAPNTSYLSIAGGALTNSRYVMCTAKTTGTGITPWFMGAVGAGNQSVSSTAVATLAPGAAVCPKAPIGMCIASPPSPGAPASPPHYGYAVDKWVVAQFTSGGGLSSTDACATTPTCTPAGSPACTKPGCTPYGSFRWIDYTPPAGGAPEVEAILNGTSTTCNVAVGTNVVEPGTSASVRVAYNGRFGIYAPGGGPTAPTPTTVPMDRTGYSYPSKAPGPVINIGDAGAYADYRSRQGTYANFISAEYAGGGSVPPSTTYATTVQRQTFGTERRLIATPFINCTSGVGTPKAIVGFGCFLMLNPMFTGSGNTDVFLQYRGLAGTPGSPCLNGGSTGGALSTGPQVPTLVQ